MNIAKLTLKLAIGSLILLIIGTAGARIGAFDYQTGLLMFSLAGLISFISICASALFTRRATQEKDRQRLSNAALIALPAILFFGLSLFQGAGAPLIHDISTDTRQPPGFIKAAELRLADENSLEYLASSAAQQTQAYPDIKTYNSKLTLDFAHARALQLAEEMNWQVHYQTPGHIEALAKSFWYGFIDDIVIRITPTANGSAIDLRSASRVGKGDLGANTKRIRQFLQAFEAKEQ